MFMYEESLTKKQQIQRNLLEYLENDENLEKNYQNLIELLQYQKIREDKHDLNLILHLILKISNNHSRGQNFISKLCKIILFFEKDIAKYLSNYEIFRLFKSDKSILLFLFQQRILIFDQIIANDMSRYKLYTKKYPQFFSPEFKPFIENLSIKKDNEGFYSELIIRQLREDICKELPNDFEEKRKTGENDNYICQLIRKDLIEEFIIYMNKNNLSVNSQIIQSIYETNSFLLKSQPKLIEYAAFFGSFQIFKYLFHNKAEINFKIWFYAIHSDTPEMIHILEENKIMSSDETYKECFRESIKCHHNEIASYIQQKYMDSTNFDFDSNCFKFYNFAYFPKNLENSLF